MDDETRTLFNRMDISKQVLTGKLLEPTQAIAPTRFLGYDADSDRPVVESNSGDRRVVHSSATNGLMQPGQNVKQVGRGASARIDSMPRVKPQAIATVAAPEVFADAVPILFTRRNGGLREFWLGGDRDSPILLDSFPPLDLFTNPWEVTLGSGPTVPAGPSFDIFVTFTGTSGASSLVYRTTVDVILPTIVVQKTLGSLACDPDSGTQLALITGTFAASQALGTTAPSSGVTLTETEFTTDFLSGTQTFLNKDRLALLNPAANTPITIDARVNVLSGGTTRTATIDCSVFTEFIPCYLSATPGKRFVLLQPAPGVLAYYEIEANSDDFSKSEFSAPGPVAASEDDWRSPLATFEQLDFPFAVGDACQRQYFLDYAPLRRFGSNIAGDRLARVDSFTTATNPKLLYQQTTPPGAEPLVNSADITLPVVYSDIAASGGICTLSNTAQKDIEVTSLQTPDAQILAIAPVVVEEE